MRRKPDEQEFVRFRKQDTHTSGVARLDRESLEGVMRDDVFLDGDGKALAFEPSEMWMRARRTGRRA
jgi:hypothetical protein